MLRDTDPNNLPKGESPIETIRRQFDELAEREPSKRVEFSVYCPLSAAFGRKSRTKVRPAVKVAEHCYEVEAFDMGEVHGCRMRVKLLWRAGTETDINLQDKVGDCVHGILAISACRINLDPNGEDTLDMTCEGWSK